jgi:hypothetical protein
MRLHHPFRLALLAALACSAAAFAQPSSNDPESVIRSLFTAMYSNDVQAYNAITVPAPGRNRLTTGGTVNASKLDQLRENPEGLQMRELRPFLFRGKEAEPDTRGEWPDGTTALYMAAHYSSPMAVRLVKQRDGWKVDVRWWVAMADLGDGVTPAKGTAAFAARALTSALIRLDRKAAASFVATRDNVNLLFVGAPSQREPSGQLDALAMEMPIVELGPGEFAVMPTGRIVEGTSQTDVKTLVGMFGPVELPFIVRKINGDWKVEAEPYFALLMQ